MSDQEFNPQVVRIERPAHHYTYLVSPNGDWLVSDGSKLSVQGFVDDQAIWEVDSDGFRHVVTGQKVIASETTVEQTCRLMLADLAVGADGQLGESADFMIEHGPARLPSEYLADLKEQGFVSMACILSPSIVDGLRKVGCVDEYEGTTPEKKHPVTVHTAVTKATVEPISLWMMRQYMGFDVKLGHGPGVSSLPPDDGKREVQGWHTDFPYLLGTGDRITTPSGQLVLGMQRNTAVSDFTLENGATLFRLGSHALDTIPTRDWGITNDTFRKGYRAEHGLPYGGQETQVIEAPAGSMVLYDSRTWHRAGVNRTGKKRGAMIQAFIPGFIIPFMDTSQSFKAFLESDMPAQLTAREARELEKLMVHRIMGPAGLYAITVDDELTGRVREQVSARSVY